MQLEQAFGAQVTFIDDNGNYISLDTAGHENDSQDQENLLAEATTRNTPENVNSSLPPRDSLVVAMAADDIFYEESDIYVKNSSEDFEEMDAAEILESKPPAKTVDTTSNVTFSKLPPAFRIRLV